MKSVFNHDYFECVCGIPEHTLRFTFIQDPIFDDEGEVYVETFLASHFGFWKRLRVAVKYLFKYGKIEGQFDCTILSMAESVKLAELLLANRAKVLARRADKATSEP